MISENEYQSLVSTAFKRLVKGLDLCDPDVLEADATGDMITVTVKSGEKVIVNTQRAVHQLWVAGRGAGIHFSWDGAKWADDKGKGLELFAWVSECVSAASGEKLSL